MPPSTTRHLAAVALALLTVTAGCAGLSDLAPGGSRSAFETTELDSLQTFGPHCGDPRSRNSSSVSRPVPGGRTLSINTTLPVRSNATELDARLEEIGPHRYRLDVERTNGGTGTPGCYLETRYNATLNLTDDVTDDYTVLVTYDGVLVASYYADPGGSGATSGLAPATAYAPWVRNVTGDGVGSAGGSGGSSGTDAASDSGGSSGAGSPA